VLPILYFLVPKRGNRPLWLVGWGGRGGRGLFWDVALFSPPLSGRFCWFCVERGGGIPSVDPLFPWFWPILGCCVGVVGGTPHFFRDPFPQPLFFISHPNRGDPLHFVGALVLFFFVLFWVVFLFF